MLLIMVIYRSRGEAFAILSTREVSSSAYEVEHALELPALNTSGAALLADHSLRSRI